uniref:Putative secreted protein n=1 Tax=Amblyomma cajennense TaxID=34607 RepID=A0A023FD37_AMBCJ
MLGNVLDEIIMVATTIVPLRVLLVILGHPVQSREACDLELGVNIIGSGIHLDNFHIFVSKLKKLSVACFRYYPPQHNSM